MSDTKAKRKKKTGRPRSGPSYLRKGGRAITYVYDGAGRRHQVSLGPYGSPASRRAWQEVCAKVLLGVPVVEARDDAGGRSARPTEATGAGVTVEELVARFLVWAKDYYHKDGEPSREWHSFRNCFRTLIEFYGDIPASEFSPKKLKAIRATWVERGRWTRGNVNKQVVRLRRLWKWGAEEELVPGHIYDDLTKVAGLRRGRAGVREGRRVLPVAWETVERTLPHLPEMIRALVLLAWHSGARIGELARMRRRDLDMTGEVWRFIPESHKTQAQGRDRTVYLGPRAQEALRPWLNVLPHLYVFAPSRSEARRRADMRERRKTKVPPSQRERARRARENPRREFRDFYKTAALGRSLHRACRQAGVEPWGWHQLRHARGTEVRRRYGLEGAQVTLGHARADVTQVYAERDADLARRIARETG